MTNSSKEMCSCLKGELIPTFEYESHTVIKNGRKHTKKLKVLFSRCDVCHSEITNSEQSRKNKETMMKFRERVDFLY